MRVGLVGAGLQGWRRARVLRNPDGADRLVVAADAKPDAVSRLAREVGCEASTRWEEVVERDDVDAILICTPPHLHHPISLAAMRRGKHVLCEKPLARTLAEACEMVETAQACGITLKCGLSLRHHPGIKLAHSWVREGLLGELNFIRCRYGIPGKPNYQGDWRADPQVSGGGELVDQGTHVLDLFRWFMGDFTEVIGMITTRFWPIEPLEDNAFALLRTDRGQVASLHCSWTQWKPLFSFEVFGSDGYAVVEGLGGAYGTERAIIGRRALEKPFAEKVVEFRDDDDSWKDEWLEFVSAIREGRRPLGDGQDGLEALRMVTVLYDSAEKGRVLGLKDGQY